jgi:glyoxylase-like metal-dependent hydrolase (beta-lactamase superfamily II)
MPSDHWAISCSAVLVLFIARATTTSAAPMPSAAGNVQITVLYDAFGKASTMKKDWGYAALIEYGGKRILFDTGNNPDILAQNAKAKGVDLRKLDFVVMSHRHGDHMGGLTYVEVVSNVWIGDPSVTSDSLPHLLLGSCAILFAKGFPYDTGWQDREMTKEAASDDEVVRTVEFEQKGFSRL